MNARTAQEGPSKAFPTVRADILERMEGASPAYMAAVATCGIVVAWALFAWAYQIVNGIGHTGLRRPVYWGFYIVNFVFWIGISHAGTLISAILRLTGAAGASRSHALRKRLPCSA